MDVKTAGQLGGQMTLQKRGKAYFKQLSLKAIEAKRLKKQLAEKENMPISSR